MGHGTFRRCCAAASVAIVLAGCSSGGQQTGSLDPFAGVGSPLYSKPGPLPKGGGRYHVGNSYQVAGRWFHPKRDTEYDKIGTASWYGPQFHRRMTSNGEWFDMEYLSAAHPTLPLPSYAKVTNLENGRAVIVRVNDRGPFVGTRIIDMSKRASETLAFKQAGKAKVRVEYIGPAPLDDKGRHLLAMNRELGRGTPVRRMIAAADGQKFAEPTVRVAAAEPMPPVPGDYFVQVGSFSDPDNAERTRSQLASVGPVEVQELDGNTGPLYRVRVGPLEDVDRAEIALSRVVNAGHDDARLILASGTL